MIANALPEQPLPVLLLRANDLVFRAFRRCSSCADERTVRNDLKCGSYMARLEAARHSPLGEQCFYGVETNNHNAYRRRAFLNLTRV